MSVIIWASTLLYDGWRGASGLSMESGFSREE